MYISVEGHVSSDKGTDDRKNVEFYNLRGGKDETWTFILNMRLLHHCHSLMSHYTKKCHEGHEGHEEIGSVN